MRSRRLRGMRWLLAALVGVFALAGCSIPSAGAAAVVNGVTIPVASIEAPVEALGGGETQVAQPNAIVVTQAVRGVVARQIAAERGLQLTGEPRTRMLAANPGLTEFAGDPRVQGLIDDILDVNLVLTAVGEQEFMRVLGEATVKVNPRYGAWSQEAGAVAVAGGQLARPWTSTAS